MSDWQIETIDSTGNVGQYTSLVLDVQGNPHISYYDVTNREIKHAWFDGSTWHTETVDSLSSNYATSIAVDVSGNTHIAYYSSSITALKYAWFDGTWHTETVDNNGNVGQYPSLALDSNGRPHIAYNSYLYGLQYAWFDGTWHIETAGNGSNGEPISLALDSNDRPHVAYLANTGYLTYVYFNGSTWHAETVDSTIPSGSYGISMVLDAGGNPHIGYYDYSNGDLKYAWFDGTWHTETVDNTGDVGRYASLALNASGNPHISYYDVTNGDLKYIWFDGSTWYTETVDSAGDVGQYTSLVLDVQGNPHISYYDVTNQNLKYAYIIYIPPEPEPPEPIIVLSGKQSVVGWAKESAWGTTPTSGSDPAKTISGIVFFPCKEENVQAVLNATAQKDDMANDRQISRTISDAVPVRGTLRFHIGAQTIGYVFTQIFGLPETTALADGVYQHVWFPNQQPRAGWPVPFSIESQYGQVRSKLLQGCIIQKASLDVGNNSAMLAICDFMAKSGIWLYPSTDATHGSGTLDTRGKVRPAVMTVNPPLVDEEPWHFMQMLAYPTVAGIESQKVLDLSLDLAFPNLRGLFMAGSGEEIGSYDTSLFQVAGNCTVEFESQSLWYQFARGLAWDLSVTLTGSLISGSYYNQILMEAFSCKVAANAIVNKSGALRYVFGFSGAKDPEQGASCQMTVVNTVSSYA